MPNQQNRRDFLQSTAAVGAGYWVLGGVASAQSKSPNEKRQIGGVAVGGKGDSDVTNASRFGKIAALCDIDDQTLAGKESVMKPGNTFNDYREMFDKMGDKLDVVVVSTPDHMHAVRSEEHTSELQSRENLVCRLLLEKKTNHTHDATDQPRQKWLSTARINIQPGRGKAGDDTSTGGDSVAGVYRARHYHRPRQETADG